MLGMTDYYDWMIPIDLDIDMLRCFMEVTKSGSFTLAGKKIGLTQSGVSVKIRRLEERLTTQIFNRTSKSLSLTLEGELLLDYAARILAVHDEAVSRLTRPKACGELRIGLIDYFLPDLLPGLLSNFRKQYPNIHLEVQTGFGLDLIPKFERGELDIVVTGKDAYEGDHRILVQEPLVWVVGSESEVSIHEDPIPLVLLPSPCKFRRLSIEGLEKINREWEVLFTGTSMANIQAAVQAGMGLSILPGGALKEGIKKAPSSLGLPDLPMYPIVLLTDEKKDHPARDVFVSFLEAELENLTR